MKNILLLCFLFHVTLQVVAQDTMKVPVTDIYIGRNFITNTDIRAKRYDFAESIYKWGVDDSTKMMTLQFRGTMNAGSDLRDSGNVALVNLLTGDMLWKQEINFMNSSFEQYDTVLIKTDGNASSRLNLATGENNWSSKYSFCYVNPHLQIGVGYTSSTNGAGISRIEGVDMKTGKSLWKRKINKNYSVNEFIPLNDSVIVFSANGLHLAQLKNGKGWDYDAQTGKKDYSATVAANVINFTFSALFGNDFEYTSGHNLISGVLSNTLVDSTGMYMADNSSIVKLDRHGNEIWRNELPKKRVSRSSIIIKDSVIVMVNDGFALLNSELTRYGIPFIAAFEKYTGEQIFLKKVGYKNDQILSYNIQQDTVFLLTKNRVLKHSLRDGSEIWERYFKTDSLGELSKFGGKELYIQMDSSIITPVCSAPNSVSVFNDKNELLVLDNYLKTTAVIPNDQIYMCYLKHKNLSFFDDGISTVVTDDPHQPIATLDVSGNSVLIGSKLFEIEGKSLIVIDIDQLSH